MVGCRWTTTTPGSSCSDQMLRDARAVADAIASEAFHNVSFVAEPIERVRRALR